MTNRKNSNPLNQPARCQHLTAKRRRCRLSVVNDRVGLCFRHLAQQAAQASSGSTAVVPIHDTPELLAHTADLRSALAGELKEFKSAAEINEFLGRLLLLLSENRVAPRRAAVLAYVCNLLLRTLPAIQRELELSDPDWNTPRFDFGYLAKPDPSAVHEPIPDSPPPSDSRALGTL
jgi:hypothetical protein